MPQLFVTNYTTVSDREIRITEERVVTQAMRVLRMKAGDRLFVQLPGSPTERLEVVCETLTKQQIAGTIVGRFSAPTLTGATTMYIALPNKAEKMELIVQKLTEVGIEHTCFWRAQRSQQTDITPQRQLRVEKIALEAVEQSWGRSLPTIALVAREQIPSGGIVFDADDTAHTQDMKTKEQAHHGIVGPEGGFSPDEKGYFLAQGNRVVSLGSTVLRMETAAIVGGWWIKNKHSLG